MVCHPSIDADSPELINCVLAEKKRNTDAPRNYTALRPEDALTGGQVPDEPPPEDQQGDIQAITKRVSTSYT